MKVKTMVSEPIQKPDGSWKVISYEIEEDIPDLDRENVLCNSCKTKNYPECKEICNCWKETDDES